MKKVLVYPCGTEIGLEIYKAVSKSIHYEIWGGSSSFDHGRFVYKNHIDNLPFITDSSNLEEIIAFNDIIKDYGFDFVYPAMDGVLTVFSKYRSFLTPIIIAPSYKTSEITRSKRKTYQLLKNDVKIPTIYSKETEIKEFPIFIKPDVGQGSVGAVKVNNIDELHIVKKNDDSQLMLEFLPGKEYTVDCFTNKDGELVYFKGRTRKRIRNGISVNACFCERPEFQDYANAINKKLQQKGAWFFQLKEDSKGELKLLEVASRIAGTSAIQRNVGINLPLLTLNTFSGMDVKNVIENTYTIELDRSLSNTYKIELEYDIVYIDYDDTIVRLEKINTEIIRFLYQCINKKKKIVLISKHSGDLKLELSKRRLDGIFDEIIHISKNDQKYRYMTSTNAIFVDDSYGERKEVFENLGINVFDTTMIECLLEDE